MNRCLVFVGWVFLTVCLLIGSNRVQAADGSPKTAAPTPGVVIKGKSEKQIRAATSKFFIGRGYSETVGANGELIYLKSRGKADESSEAKQCLRIRVRIGKPEKGNIRVLSRSFGVEDCGTAKEKELPTPGGYPQIQGFLDAIKNSLASK